MKKMFVALMMILSTHAIADISCVDGVLLRIRNPNIDQRPSLYIEIVENQDNQTQLHTYWNNNVDVVTVFKTFRQFDFNQTFIGTDSSDPNTTYLKIACNGNRARVTVTTVSNEFGTSSINYYSYWE